MNAYRELPEEYQSDLPEDYQWDFPEVYLPDPRLPLKKWARNNATQFKDKFFKHWDCLCNISSFEVLSNSYMTEHPSWTNKSKQKGLYKYLLMASAAFSATDNHTGLILLLIIWEVYGDNPAQFSRMYTLVSAKNNGLSWLDNLMPDSATVENGLKDSIFDKLPTIRQLLRLRKGDSFLVERLYKDVENKMKDKIFKFYYYRIQHFLKQDAVPRDEESKVLAKTKAEEDPYDVLFLYASSGFGKTRMIESLLRRNWGYIFLPGNIHSAVPPNLYEARRDGHSKDSCRLFTLMDDIGESMPTAFFHEKMPWHWSERLVLSRHLVFDRFLKLATTEKRTPANWLRFQKSCSTFDVFDRLFGLFLLVVSDSGSLKFEIGELHKLFPMETQYRSSRSSKTPFYFCIDEAQCYFDARLHDLTDFGKKYKNHLELILEDGLTRTISSFPSMNMKVIVSGTSMNSKDMLSTIEKTRVFGVFGVIGAYTEYPRRDLTITKVTYLTKTDFPLLMNSKALEDFIEECGMLEKTRPHLKTILEHGIPLRGRYLWSALYVGRLAECTVLSPRVISDIALETINRIKGDLKVRLTRLHDEGRKDILEELCWVVIQSDLLDCPTIFKHDREMQMISEAFAVVIKKGDVLVGEIGERLAMEAAIEWFQEQNWPSYEGKMEEFLRQQTGDASSFGKAAEWFLALELWSCLKDSSHLAGSTGEERRREILKRLSAAHPIGTDVRQLSLKLQHSTLVKGVKIGHVSNGRESSSSSSRSTTDESVQFTSGSDVQLWEWMKSIRSGQKPAASFYFPDNLAGPDLLFALNQGPGSSDIVLCVLQEELEHWKERTIIRILVWTKHDSLAERYDEKIKAHFEQETNTSRYEYFAEFAMKDTEVLFGETFARMAEAKAARQNLTQLLKIRSKKRKPDEDISSLTRKKFKA
ncbi:MAG: hypothetical protein M1821_002425 [Bathelium mastoideum]|nr:MAG: hypothetical protein M1821_002425 [Bathelium mastoideum]